MPHDGASPTAIGIDLGTTFSVIAHVDSYGRPQTILNSDGDATLPSAVLFDRDSVVVGKDAIAAAAFEPDRVVRFAKREMGSKYLSQTIAGKSDWPPEVIQSLILRRLKEDAERVVGPVDKAVITVPAYFNDPRRLATQEAGKLADLEVLDVINEPTAAAIAYCHGRQQDAAKNKSELILVYDLGGGTFDVTLVRMTGGHFHTLATDGDVNLGGVDWDQRIADHVAEEYMRSNRGIDPRQDPAANQALIQRAEDAKRTLSQRSSADVRLAPPHACRVTITREKFEELTVDLLERTRWTCDKVREAAGVAWSDVDTVLLVGGSSLMPMVGKMLHETTGKEPCRAVSPHESVAHGAAIYARAILDERAGLPPTLSVRNVNPHELGVKIFNKARVPSRSVLIPRNQPLPATGRGRFTTIGAGSRLRLEVYEGGDERCTYGRIGEVVMEVPSNVPPGSPVEVTFEYQTNGVLRVYVSLPSIPLHWEGKLDRG